MKYIIIITSLFLNQFSYAASMNTYDCELVSGEFNVPKLFELDRFSSEYVLFNLDGYSDKITYLDRIGDITKFAGHSKVFGDLDIEYYQDRFIRLGAATGDISVVIDNYSYEYHCSLNWSPY